MQESRLLVRTSELLQTTLIPMSRIAREMGCHVSTVKAIRDRQNDPGVTICENIYNLLSKHELEVK